MTVNVVGHLDGVARESGATSTGRSAMFMVFRLYETPGTGLLRDKGTPLWGRQTAVALENGDFDVDLCDSLGAAVSDARYATLAEAVDVALARGSSVLYVGITPENDSNAEIFPRLRVTAVPKAVQAAYVRTVPGNFTVTGGTFRAERLIVEDAGTTIKGATYGAATFSGGSRGSVLFSGGLAVSGTLEAGEVDVASSVKTSSVTTENLAPQGTLTVDGTLTSAGIPTWKGDLGQSEGTGPTVAVSVVTGTVRAKEVADVRHLKVNSLVSNGTYFDQSDGLSMLGDVVTVDGVASLQGTSRSPQMTCWDEKTAILVNRTAVLDGLWTAPCDCLAYFQTRVVNASSSYGACVQFYLVADANDSALTDRPPDAVASLRNGSSTGASLDFAVPILLRKGQLVRWLGYNANGEASYSYVKSITYRMFNW